MFFLGDFKPLTGDLRGSKALGIGLYRLLLLLDPPLALGEVRPISILFLSFLISLLYPR